MIKHTIYQLRCGICKEYYIGQTKGTILDRFTQHSNDANRGSKTRLHHHMRMHGIGNFKIKKIRSINTDNVELVNDFEQFFIKLMKPKLNIAIRRVREIGYKVYQRQYRQKKRNEGSYRCSACDLNCISGLHLNIHFDTQKHKKNSMRLMF